MYKRQTLGYVLPYYFGGRGGLYEELDRKTRQRMEQGFVETNGLHPDCKLFVQEQEAEKAGAEIRCEAALTGVYLEGKSVAVSYTHLDVYKRQGSQ